MRYHILLVLFTLLVFSCKNKTANSGSTAAAPADLSGYTITDFPNSKFQRATLINATGKVLEEGELYEGKKTGTWVTYHDQGNIMTSSITNYVDGKKNGILVLMNNRSQVESYGYYKNDVKDGKWVSYKYSRRELEEDYKDGKLHGFRRTFYNTGKDGQVKEEVQFKNGVQDGVYRYYSDSGAITMDYVYKDGKIVERKKVGN